MTHKTKVAYVFSGQGSQAAGMGLDIYSRYASAKNVFNEVDDILGFSLSRLCFEGPDEELTKTINGQPAMLAVSIAYLRTAREVLGASLPIPDFMAGHSLGEYSALVANGVFDLADGIRLVRERGRLMYEAGQAMPGSMIAVIGADEKTINKICTLTGTQISNINSPGQIVVSGALANLEEFKKQALKEGLRRMIPLKVSGAFHSDLMKPAVSGLRQAIQRCNFHKSEIPIISNVTAEIISDNEVIKQELIDQITSCVQWQRSIEKMLENGVNTFYEIGHGQVLVGLIKRINSDVQVNHITDLIK